MGLRYYVTPSEQDASAKAPVDKTAARARSTIRRHQRRPMGALHRSHAVYRAVEGLNGSREMRTAPTSALDPPAPPVAHTPGDLDEAWLQTERPGEALSAAMEHARAEMVELGPLSAYSTYVPAYMRRVPDSSRPAMPPVPESGDYLSGARRHHLRRTFDSARDLRWDYRVARRRAVAMQAEEADPASSLLSPSSPHVRPQGAGPWRASSEEFPPLTQVGPRMFVADLTARGAESRRSRQTPLPRGVNGLGDRDRSISPDNDGAWETIRTTLTPDPQPPSASSSFVSAVASSSVNPHSTNTSLTTMSSAEDGAGNACEATDSNLSETDPDEDETDMYESQRPLLVPAEPQWMSYADAADTQASRRNEAEESVGLGGLQRIVRRLARREDIPDEWWAEAGLSRTLPRESP